MECYIEIGYIGGASEIFSDIIAFSFDRERYTPYTYLTASIIGKTDPFKAAWVKLYCDGSLLHHGTADSLEFSAEKGRRVIRLRSYSFSKQLGQNYSDTGIIPTPDLYAVLKSCGVPHVDCEEDTNTVNYVYINERTTAWDAICIYAMKAYGTSPYIYSTNTVRCTPVPNRRYLAYSSVNLVSVKSGVQLLNVFSDVYISGLSGETECNQHNEFASDRNVMRRKYYNYDREWAYDLKDEAKFYMHYSNRGRLYKSFVYKGFRGEQLLDKATVSCGDLAMGSYDIGGIKLTGSSKGVFTEIRCYLDSYCNQDKDTG